MIGRFIGRQSYGWLLTNALISATALAFNVDSFQDRQAISRPGGQVSVDNFGKIKDHIYRGAQPQDSQYQELAALGIRTVIDLRAEANSGSRGSAERAGLRYINLPLADKAYPQAGEAERFLEIVNNKANWPVYVHCAGGRHRSGAMLAVYRMKVDGWTADQAYAEMKHYGFYQRNNHGRYKKYIYDYYRSLQASTGPKKPGSAIQPKEAKRQTP